MARNEKYALSVKLHWIFLYLFLSIYFFASFPISKPEMGFPQGSCFLTSYKSGSINESKIKWLLPMPTDGKEGRFIWIERSDIFPLYLYSYITYSWSTHLKPGSGKCYKWINLFYLLVTQWGNYYKFTAEEIVS